MVFGWLIQVDRIISLWAHSDLVPVKPILDPSEIERLSNVGLDILGPDWNASCILQQTSQRALKSLKNVVITFYYQGERSEEGIPNKIGFKVLTWNKKQAQFEVSQN